MEHQSEDNSEIDNNDFEEMGTYGKPDFKIDGCSIEDFTKQGLGLIVDATKCINAFPSGPTRSLYSAYPTFSNIVDTQSSHILDIISNVLKLQHIKGNIQRRDNDEQFELLLECNDVMHENINSNLDELAGIRKVSETVLVQAEIQTVETPKKQASGSWNENENTSLSKKTKTAKLLTARNIVRPQINFKVPVDNSPTPFEPKLKYKPNSLKPLAILPEYGEDNSIESFLHPYEFELSKFEVPRSQLTNVKPIKPADLKITPLIYVNSELKLKNLLDDLRAVKEIAVDLEHHAYRTFLGITCLMQISTRYKDYIIDTLVLREELHILNEIFTNPSVVKIFHGADSDVEWLQRDLAIYVVNMFDTHQAAKRLGLARLSLAFLLKQYCQLDTDKTFQLADWRLRPLPEELILYARQDTHYLLYVYDILKNEILTMANGQTNLLQSVYQSSTEICRKKYKKPIMQLDSHTELYSKSKRIFDNRQLYALKAIFSWRDKMARQEDESYGYVLPNHMILQIAEHLPREMQGILACCNPIPPLLRQNLQVLHQYILIARSQPLVKPILEDQTINRASALNKNKVLSTQFFCPHDLSYNTEFRDDLPTLLGNKPEKNVVTNLHLFSKSVLSVFDTPDNSDDDDEVKEKIRKINRIKFVSPYARYLAVLPLAEQQRLEELAKIEEENKKKKLCPDKNEEEYVIKQETIDQEDYYVHPVSLKEHGKRVRNETQTLKPNKKQKLNDVIVSKSELTDLEIDNTAVHNSSIKAESDSKLLNSKDNGNNSMIKKKKKKQIKTNVTKSTQSSNKPVPFDYSQVDFNKFQGGSKQNKTKNSDVNTKHHAKNKNNRGNNKKFNKLFSFSKVNKKN